MTVEGLWGVRGLPRQKWQTWRVPYRVRLTARVGAILIHLVKDGQQECSRLARTWNTSKLHRLADVAAKFPASLVYRLCLVSFTLHFTNTNLNGSHKPYSFCHQESHAAFFSKESDQSPLTFWSSHGRTLQPTLPQTACSFFLTTWPRLPGSSQQAHTP